MHYFHYRDKALFCEEVPIEAIAREVGTPFYLYSTRTLKRHFQVFDSAFKGTDHLTCFSIKSNSNIAILRLFASLGGGFDIVSGGELYRALTAGVDPSKIVYSGVGKGHEEIDYALEAGILMFNIESREEMVQVNEIAGRGGKVAPVALRVNPDIDPQTHPYIATGLKKSKFGIDIHRSLHEYRHARTFGNLEVVGVDCHIGSQITETAPFVEALRKVRDLVLTLKSEGFAIRYLDMGGGLGITYDDEAPPDPKDYARALVSDINDLGCTIILEPGRVIVGNAGILVTKVLYLKQSGKKNFVVVDAAMNDLIRPSLYGSYHGIQPVQKRGRKKTVVDVVGPICESADFLARDRSLPTFKPGELMAIMSAGAYGFTMASNYNSRPRIPEILVHDDHYEVIREREGFEDLVKGEIIPRFLQ